MFCEQIKFYHKKLNKEGSMTANEPNNNPSQLIYNY